MFVIEDSKDFDSFTLNNLLQFAVENGPQIFVV